MLSMRGKLLFLAVLSCSFLSSSNALDLQNLPWFVGVDVNQSSLSVRGSNVTYPVSDDTQSKNKAKGATTFTLTGGFTLDKLIRLGLSYQIGSYNISGQGNPYGTPQSVAAYGFKYKLAQQSLNLYANWTLFQEDKFYAYAQTALGMTMNKTQGYSEHVNIPNYPKIDYQFTGKSSSGFVYSLGLGATYAIEKEWRIGLQYSYQDLGKIKLGSSPVADTVSPSYSLSNQAISLVLRYDFN